MLYGNAGITTKELAEKLVSSVLSKVGNDPPPIAGGSRSKWTVAVKDVLQAMGSRLGYSNHLEFCSIDLMWWTEHSGNSKDRLILVAESELKSKIGDVEDDFLKLRLFKCPLKLLVFSSDLNKIREIAETDLHLFEQHVKGEEYLLIGFTASGPRCLHFVVPHDGKLNKVKFEEFQVSTPVLTHA